MKILIQVFIYLWMCLAVSGKEIQEVGIARGRLVERTNSFHFDTALYDIYEVGRGDIPFGPSRVYYYSGFIHLPEDAILLLSGANFSEKIPEYRALSYEPTYGIRPYSEEAWQVLLLKSNAELSQTPESERISEQEAQRLLIEHIIQNDDDPEYIYLSPALRFPFGWYVDAIFTVETGMLGIHATVTDKGRFRAPTYKIIPHDSLVKEGESHVDEDLLEQAIATYYSATKPEYWPFRVRGGGQGDSLSHWPINRE